MNSLICLPANETGGPSAWACAAALDATKSEAAKSDATNRHCRDFVIGVIVDCDPRPHLINALYGSAIGAPLEVECWRIFIWSRAFVAEVGNQSLSVSGC